MSKLILELVEDLSQIRDNILTFNQEAHSFIDIAKELTRTTSLWVDDPDSNSFGCSKFIGFRSMTKRNRL